MSRTFEITIQRKSADHWPIVVQQVTSGAELPVRREGVLVLAPHELLEVSPREYGAVLGRALFRDRVRDGFMKALEHDDPLHVLLYVEDGELRSLRWERLAAPLDGGWTPLALDQRTPFALHLPSATDRRFPPISRLDLRALIVVANPTRPEKWRLTTFDVAAAVRGVRESLGPIPSDVLAEFEGAIGPPTLDALCNAITGQAYTLLHVVAHGRFKADDGEPTLFLSTLEGEVAPVPARVLVERLGKLRGARGLPHFAFLSTCEGAAPEAEGVLGGLGQRLVRELGMPAVVAMTDKVTVASATTLASEFYRRLRRHGEVDLALAESCARLAARPDVAVPVPALFSRLAGRPLFSLAPDGYLSPGVIARGLNRLEALLPDRAPVQLSPFRSHATALRDLLGADADQLTRERRTERERALAGVDELCQEVLELRFEALAHDQEPPPYDGRCPFRGLEAFNPFRPPKSLRGKRDLTDDPRNDPRFFFGREGWVVRLRERLAQHPFLAVLGPSGSGKSSVVLAGLVPGLQEREPGLRAAVLTPGSNPSTALEAKLAEVGEGPAVVVVDQFEEVFTLCTDPASRQVFLDRLLALSATMRVVVTMRADFWGDCAPYSALRERMLAHQELIPPMTLEELRLSMTSQAEAVGLRFEPGLVGTILDDVAGEPGAMPLLQHALLELWKRRHGRRLKAEEYQALGKVQGAIAKTAEAAYGALRDDRERNRVWDIFLRLTRLDEQTAPGEQRRDSRRRARLEDLVPSGGELAETKALVNRLADSRLVVTTPRGEERLTEVEVVHEALIRHWPRLTTWLDEDRAILRLRQGISESASDWAKGGRDENLLEHRGPRLQDAERQRSAPRFVLNDMEREYLDACVELREREQVERERQRRKRIQYITNWLVVSLILGAFAAIQWWRAEQQRRESQRALASLAMDRGAAYCEQGEIDRGVLWLARSLEIAPTDDVNLQRSIRSQLSGWMRQLHDLKAWMEHEGVVTAVAFAPDGKTVLTGSADNTARLWDAATGKPLGGPMQHGDHVEAVAFAPDGKTVLTGSWDKTARLWDAATGKPLGGPMQHQELVTAVAFAPDGKTALSGSFDNTARLWDAATGKPLGEPMQHQHFVTAVAFAPDGKTVLTGSADNTARLWDAATGKPLDGPMQHRESVGAVAFAPDGRTALTGCDDGTARLWDVPAPVEAESGRIVSWIRVMTGRELDDKGGIHPLDGKTWHRDRQRLNELGWVSQ